MTPSELPPDVLRDALVLLDAWDQRMQDQRRKMLTRMSAVHGDKIRLGLDSASVDSPLGTQLLARAEQDPGIRAHRYSVGADVLADGNPGQVVAVIRQGEDVVFDEALASLWELHDAALVDLKALLAPHL